MATKQKGELQDVVSLLTQIQDNAKAAEKATAKVCEVADEQLIKALEPEPSLIYAWEPDFDPCYTMTRPSGSSITVQHIWDAYIDGEVIVLVGPTGCGKSALAFHLMDRVNAGTRAKNSQILARNALKLKSNPDMKTEDLEGYIPLPYEVAFLACKNGTRSEDLVGTVDLIYDAKGNKKPVVRFGAVTDAWVNGKTLIMEEADTLDPGVAVELHAYLDGRTKETMLYINGPQKVLRHSRFSSILTQNSLSDGANQLEFAGTVNQNGALVNRFSYVVQVGWMQPANEAALLVKKTGIDKDSARDMVVAATQVRDEYDKDQCSNVISTRDLLSWSRETIRETKRSGIPHTNSSYWSEVVVASAFPSFLNILSDEATVQMIVGLLDTIR